MDYSDVTGDSPDPDFHEASGCEVDDILKNIKTKRKVNSKMKGNRVELELTKILTKRFDKPFSRAVGSGNRWGQVANLPSHAKTTLTGDICPPEGFLWVIECKGGYEDKIDLNNLGESIAQLDAFIKQSSHDAEESHRQPIIVWKRARKPWLAMVKSVDIEGWTHLFEHRMYYKGWVAVQLEPLLTLTPDKFWFEQT